MAKNNIRVVCLVISLALISIVIPWEAVIPSGTGDGLLTYKFLQYSLAWLPPIVSADLYGQHASTRPDWFIIAVELLTLLATSWILRPKYLRLARGVVFETTTTLIFIAMLFTGIVLGMSMLTVQLEAANHWTLHTYEVLEELQKVRNGLSLPQKDLELPQIDVGNSPVYLEYAKLHLERVKKLTEDNAEQQHACLEIFDKLQTVATATKDTRKRLQIIVSAMEKAEGTLLVRRTASLKSLQSNIWFVIAVLAAACLASLYWVGSLVNRAVTALQIEIDVRIETERKLSDAADNLRRSNEELQQFAYIASHDLQEPLRAVIGFLSLLKREYEADLDESANRYIAFAVDGAQRMSALITDLLKFAKIETKGQVFDRVNLIEVLKHVEADLNEQIKDNDAKINCPLNLPVVNGDVTQLRQLLQNLISNSIKFRGDNPPIVEISYETKLDQIQFEVSDNGRGFEMAHADRIFVIFQRLQTKDKAEGTGIGLALCKKIVERHGGKIWAKSEIGKGTHMIFTLPVG